jgi:hypothetical protein
MKRFLKFIGVLAGLAILAIVLMMVLTPRMDRWGATDAEIAASFPGDELVPSPRVIYNRAVTVKASPEQIYPWIVQLGAEKGGMYSYSWFETNVLQCELINADRIHEEWQDLQVGDKVKMCPGDFGPVPFDVALIEPNSAIVLGHYNNGKWSDTWHFVLIPDTDGTTRLVLRSRDAKEGWFWDAMRPGEFIMSRGMLLGIKERAEQLAKTGYVAPQVTPTPEVFIPLDKAIPDFGITLEGVHLDVAGAVLDKAFPAGCTGEPPACTQAQEDLNMLSVMFAPRDLPEGDMLAYKSLPPVSVAMEGSASVSYSLTKYDNTSHALTLGFEVPGEAAVFGLQWADLVEIPLDVRTNNE